MSEERVPARSPERAALLAAVAAVAQEQAAVAGYEEDRRGLEEKLEAGFDEMIAAERQVELSRESEPDRRIARIRGEVFPGPSLAEAEAALAKVQAGRKEIRGEIEFVDERIMQGGRRRRDAEKKRTDALKALIAAERDALDEWLAVFDMHCGMARAIGQIFCLLEPLLPPDFPHWYVDNRQFPVPADPLQPKWQAAIAALEAGEIDTELPRPKRGDGAG
jgi:hypothetical protein